MANSITSTTHVDWIAKNLSLPSGKLGVILAAAGVGKTACLTHIAITHMIRNLNVLHVCIEKNPDTIKAWYNELFKHIIKLPFTDYNQCSYPLEPHRIILSYLNQTFSVDKLHQSIDNLKNVVKFTPSLMVLDGFNAQTISYSLCEELQQLASHCNLSIWLSMRTQRDVKVTANIPYPCDALADFFYTIIDLHPDKTNIWLKILKTADRYESKPPTLSLSPETFLLQSVNT